MYRFSLLFLVLGVATMPHTNIHGQHANPSFRLKKGPVVTDIAGNEHRRSQGYRDGIPVFGEVVWEHGSDVLGADAGAKVSDKANDGIAHRGHTEGLHGGTQRHIYVSRNPWDPTLPLFECRTVEEKNTDGHLIRRFVSITDGEEIFSYPLTCTAHAEGCTASASGNSLADANRASKELYNLFMFTFGRDSYDGTGGKMRNRINFASNSCPNAFARGNRVDFCTGTIADDVVAHEWTHNYIFSMDGPVYLFESGAINEAFADVFGEIVDLLNDWGEDEGKEELRSGCDDGNTRWVIAEELSFFDGRLRDMYQPECADHPAERSSPNYACLTAEEDFGGVHINSGLVNKTFTLLADGGTHNGVTVEGIGLDLAAHIFYQTMAYYLHPTTDFQELSKVLVDAAFDLKDVPLSALTVAPDPASAPPVTLSIYDISQLINAITATGLGIESNCPGLQVPVNYTYLEATAKSKAIEVNWGTSEEVDNAGFTVERRHESESDFVALGFVEGGRSTYSFSDETALAGTNYYRLRQLDYDGTEALSTIVVARLEGGQLRAWPNPARKKMTVHAPDILGVARLFNLDGKLVARVSIDRHRGVLDVSRLTPGVYLLKVKNELRRVIVSR